ncbi:MAG: hypothetical protein QF704_17325, partial [Anaerolineales bacterium]|nr:hypothetical protein [Anaerolineales bacterium]
MIIVSYVPMQPSMIAPFVIQTITYNQISPHVLILVLVVLGTIMVLIKIPEYGNVPRVTIG